MNEEEKRAWDTFAAAALQGILANSRFFTQEDEWVRFIRPYVPAAEYAAQYADMMIDERRERFGGGDK